MSLGRRLGISLHWLDGHALAEVSLLALALVVSGWLPGPRSWWLYGSAAWLLWQLGRHMWQGWASFARHDMSRLGNRHARRQLELYWLEALSFIMAVSGGTASPFYPLLYLFMAAGGGFDSSWGNRLALVGGALLLQGALVLGQGGAVLWSRELVHALCVVGFAGSVAWLEKAWLQLVKHTSEARIKEVLARQDQQAEEYRLGSPINESARPESEDITLERSSVKEIDLGIRNVLDILERALLPNVVAVYWLSLDESQVKLREARPARRREQLQAVLDARSGLVGAVLKSRAVVEQSYGRPSERGATYYRKPQAIRYFVGAPIWEENRLRGQRFLRGVLLADRVADVPFIDENEQLLITAAREVMRIVNTERALNDHDRNHYLYRQLYGATEVILHSTGLREVAEQLARTARKVVGGADLGLLVLVEEGGRLVLTGADGDEQFSDWCQQQLGGEFAKSRSMSALAVQQGLPQKDTNFSSRARNLQVMLDPDRDPPGLGAVVVMPMFQPASEEVRVMGAVILANRRPGEFGGTRVSPDDTKRILETFCNVAALAISNARQYEKLERLATTDALTGLLNRRRFFEILDETSAEALRYQRPLGLIMCDIDHFKSINDTYGHPMGDEVLRRVARVLGEMARSTDRVCRFGGEEFAIILPQTDYQGAEQLAERFRQEIARQSFTHGKQTFSVTLSLGICVLPEHARHKEELIQHADQALYQAKEGGRNRVVAYRPPARSRALAGETP